MMSSWGKQNKENTLKSKLREMPNACLYHILWWKEDNFFQKFLIFILMFLSIQKSN